MNSKSLKLCNLILLAILNISAMATTFIETPVEDRLELSSGAIRGKFLGSSFKKNPMGKVVTEATFQVIAVSGIEPNEIINRNTFRVSYPGGEWNGMTYKVSGTPSFKQGQDVVLMVRKGKFGFILPDLALSKFDIKVRDGKETLVSEVFPNKQGVGKISLDDFNKMVKNKFGTPLVSFNTDKHIYVDENHKRVAVHAQIFNDYEGREPRSRRPASLNTEEADDSIPIIWFVLALGLLGFISNFLLRGREE